MTNTPWIWHLPWSQFSGGIFSGFIKLLVGGIFSGGILYIRAILSVSINFLFNMISKPDITCFICKHNRSLKIIKTALTEIQAEITERWKGSTIIQLDGHLNCEDNDWYVLNRKSEATIIPSYRGYDNLWTKAYIINPLEVDWQLFDIHDLLDVDYLLAVVEILEDQKDLWINDESTKGTTLMDLFLRFTRAAKRLLMFTMNLNYAI